MATVMLPEALGGDEVVPLVEAAVALRLQPARLFALGIRGDFELVRVDDRAWGLRRWQVEAALARQAEAA